MPYWLIICFKFQAKEADAARLAEELGASKAREKELESRLNTEMQRLAEEIEDLEDRRKAEVKISHFKPNRESNMS